jgi:hypothetical protein
MDFGNAIFLWALPAVLVPVLLHLFFKRRKNRVQFSTLLFFVKKEKHFAYRRKLYEILLLLLRVLAILLLVLALSRIFFKRFKFIAGAGTEAVIILDDSMSMQRKMVSGGTAFDFAKRKAEEILKSLSGDDGAALILYSGKPGINLTRDKTQVMKLVRSAQLTSASGSPGAAVENAVEQLRKAPGVNREIYIISDFRKNGMPSKALNISGLKNCRVYCLPLRGSEDNLSVQDVKLDTTPKIISRTVRIPFKIVNHGKTERDVKVELEVDGKVLQSRYVKVNGGSSTTDRFNFVPARSGRISGCVRINDNSVDFDNRGFFTLEVSGCINVLFITDTKGRGADPFFFLRAAIDPDISRPVHGIRAENAELADLSPALLKKYHIAVISVNEKISPDSASVISGFIAEGGTLLSLPQKSSVPDVYSRLEAASRRQLSGVYQKTVEFRGKGIKCYPPLTELNNLLQLDLVRWRKISRLKTSSKTKTIAVSGKDTLILEQRLGRGKWMALAFGMRRDYSNWPVLKSFPVFAAELINYAAGNSEKSVAVTCGSHIALKGDKIEFRTSWGRQGSIKTTKEAGSFSETWLPGVVNFSGADLDAAVLAAPAAESDLVCSDDAQLKKWFNAPVTLLETGSDIAAQAEQLRKGTELSGFLLLALLLVLAAEFLLGGTRTLIVNAVKDRLPGRRKK